MSIHSRLRQFRNAKGLTIKQVAEKAGIPESTYKEWENGRQIRGEPYMALAKVLEVSLQELLTGEKPKANQVLEQLDEVSRLIQQTKRDLVPFFIESKETFLSESKYCSV